MRVFWFCSKGKRNGRRPPGNEAAGRGRTGATGGGKTGNRRGKPRKNRLAAWAFLLAAATVGAQECGERLWPGNIPVGGTPRGYLCLVIDDFGYNGDGTEEMLALDVPLTAAILPFSAHSAADAQRVAAAGKEAIIHMPMESLTGKPEWVGDRGVFVGMSREEIAARVDEALEAVPLAVGLNNHMGSAVMEDEAALEAVVAALADRGLIFVDSRTTPKSRAGDLCRAAGVPLLSRSIFLDSTDDEAVVRRQLERAGQMALSTGSALAIGHVGPEGGVITARAIAALAPRLREQGVELVTLTQLADLLENDGRGLSQTGGL